MARYTFDGLTSVVWLTTYGDKNFIAQSLLNAAQRLDCFLTGDGLNIAYSENAVDDAALCEPFDAELPGSFKVSPELTLKRHIAEVDDLAYTTLANRNETGALVCRFGIDSDTSFTAGQRLEVFPGSLGQRRRRPTARNTQDAFMITIFGSEEPALDSVVVAS